MKKHFSLNWALTKKADERENALKALEKGKQLELQRKLKAENEKKTNNNTKR